MYNLYIVDDDPIVRRGLECNIDWNSINVAVAGCAANGKKALELMQSCPPQIIISDVNMPVMDGIELTYNIRKLYPETRVILLSGYDEFNYVKNALSLKVLNYILKPVDNRVLMHNVSEAILQIEKEQNIQDLIHKNLPVMRAGFLNSLVNGMDFDSRQILLQVGLLGINFIPESSPFIAGIVTIDDYCDISEITEREVAKYLVMKITRENIEQSFTAECFLRNDYIVFIISLGPSDANLPKSVSYPLSGIFRNILLTCELEAKVICTIGYGLPCSSLSEINQSFEQAKRVMEYHHISGSNMVYSPENIINSGYQNGFPEYDDFVDELVKSVRACMYDESIAIITRFENTLKEHVQTPIEYIKMIYTYALLELIKYAGYNLGNNPQSLDLFKHYKQIQSSASLDVISMELKKTVDALCSSINFGRFSIQGEIVNFAIDYINQNFNDPELSLNVVAAKVSVSPVYLSAIFKKETNANFIDFVIKARMNKAIELLRHSNKRTYEVAELVGYSNPHYFSSCFKKYTGYSPSDYKNVR